MRGAPVTVHGHSTITAGRGPWSMPSTTSSVQQRPGAHGAINAAHPCPMGPVGLRTPGQRLCHPVVLRGVDPGARGRGPPPPPGLAPRGLGRRGTRHAGATAGGGMAMRGEVARRVAMAARLPTAMGCDGGVAMHCDGGPCAQVLASRLQLPHDSDFVDAAAAAASAVASSLATPAAGGDGAEARPVPARNAAPPGSYGPGPAGRQPAAHRPAPDGDGSGGGGGDGGGGGRRDVPASVADRVRRMIAAFPGLQVTVRCPLARLLARPQPLTLPAVTHSARSHLLHPQSLTEATVFHYTRGHTHSAHSAFTLAGRLQSIGYVPNVVSGRVAGAIRVHSSTHGSSATDSPPRVHCEPADAGPPGYGSVGILQ